MKKILFDLVKYPEYGGIATVTDIVIPCLIDAGYEISIVSHRTPNKVYDGPEGVKIYYMPVPDSLNDRQNYRCYDRLLGAGAYDCIIYQDSYAPIERMVCQLAGKHGIPVIVFEHNSPASVPNSRTMRPFFSAKGFVRRAFHPFFVHKEIKRKRYLLDHCLRYVLLCGTYVKEFMSYVGIDESDKLIHIPNPVMSPDVPVDFSLKKQQVLFVGRLMPEKGVEAMLDMWKEIRGSDCAFVIVGDGPMKHAIEGKVEHGHLENVVLKGFKNPAQEYAESKVFWMNSKYEGWPMTLLEAMSYGCVPIVSNSFSAVYDIIDHGVNGFIVPSDDVSGFISYTHDILGQPELYANMAKNAVEKAKSFSPDNIIPCWLQILK